MLKEAKAFSLRTAVTMEEAGIERHEKYTLQSLVKAGKLKKTKDYRYYLPYKDKK